MLNLGPTAEHEEFARSVQRLLGRRTATGPLSADDWSALADTGLLAVGTPLAGGDTRDLVAGMRAAGSAAAQGPFIGALLAVRVLPDQAARVAGGECRVAVHGDGMATWHEGADVVLVCDGDEVWLAELFDVEPVATLADEPWARAAARRTRSLGAHPEALAAVDIARAAWMVGAGEHVLGLAATHARARHQFGRALGDLQGVAHPLAAADADLGAARDLLVLAAWRLDNDGDLAGAAAARAAATQAALRAAFLAHQVHGALGFTAELGLDRWTAAIRQMSHHPPSPAPGLARLADSAKHHSVQPATPTGAP